jgi:hypothetical protein
MQDLKALTEVLEASPFAFALELAALAARREYLNLEKWLQERVSGQRLPFVQVMWLAVCLGSTGHVYDDFQLIFLNLCRV